MRKSVILALVMLAISSLAFSSASLADCFQEISLLDVEITTGANGAPPEAIQEALPIRDSALASCQIGDEAVALDKVAQARVILALAP